jgi:hypothetical protein
MKFLHRLLCFTTQIVFVLCFRFHFHALVSLCGLSRRLFIDLYCYSSTLPSKLFARNPREIDTEQLQIHGRTCTGPLAADYRLIFQAPLLVCSCAVRTLDTSRLFGHATNCRVRQN